MIYLWIASALVALVYWLVPPIGGDGSMLNSVVKTIPVALLAMSALPQRRPLLVAALALGALGDFCLSRPGETWFIAGMGAFALAHLFYIGLFLALSGRARFVPMAMLVVYGAVMAVLLWDGTGALRLPVMAYLVIIIGMGLSALAQRPGAQMPVLLAGAGLFILSDTVLALGLFVWPNEGVYLALQWALVWPSYWLAQFALMWGFSRPEGTR
ncbi:lysoplasmalogenase [Maritimibacter sp. DP07]|uniref:Lysoplasmalogenase n=1 Tax=Maritimibacter harenae TaxID=2606218 RepID=A0A845M4X5_9RHOB|nr:lysoplasmalogenase [Maritimibacter harenae]MZR15085.1 lysoplasmalogenase [Maritimibacter harenae]